MIKLIPNLLSIFRICLVPVFIVAYFIDPNQVKINAIIILAIASFSDFLDGYIARKFKAVSSLGKVLDPMGDKLMIVAVLVCITIDGIIPFWAVLIVFIKELLMTIGGFVIHRTIKTSMPQSNIWGKVSTVVFSAVCLALMIFINIPQIIAIAMITAAIVLMLVALASYIISYDKMMKSRNNEQEL